MNLNRDLFRRTNEQAIGRVGNIIFANTPNMFYKRRTHTDGETMNLIRSATTTATDKLTSFLCWKAKSIFIQNGATVRFGLPCYFILLYEYVSLALLHPGLCLILVHDYTVCGAILFMLCRVDDTMCCLHRKPSIHLYIYNSNFVWVCAVGIRNAFVLLTERLPIHICRAPYIVDTRKCKCTRRPTVFFFVFSQQRSTTAHTHTQKLLLSSSVMPALPTLYVWALCATHTP